MTAGAAAPPGFLDGVLVVERGSRIAVGACGGLLAQLGATVVAPEPPEGDGDGKWRQRARMMAGKRSIVLRDNADDRELAAALVAAGDVLLLSTDFPRDDRADWLRPPGRRQVVCDITAFGHEGPLAGMGGSEAIVQAFGGIVDTSGPAGGAPAVVGAPVLEMSTALLAASAIVAALRVRRVHGVGQRIDMALFDTAVNELVNFLPLHYANQPVSRSGNRHPLHVPWGSYRARDGHVLICSVTGEQFARVCRAIGEPSLADDPRYATSTGRLAHYREIDARIEAWTRKRSIADCEETLSALGIACGAIVAVADLPQERNLRHRDAVLRLVDPESRATLALPAAAIRGQPQGGRSPARIPARDADRAAVVALVRAARRDADATAPAPAALPADTRPLAGLRIVEIGQYTVAPLASRQMGALGAEVIKIEPPTGDAIRKSAPLVDGESHIFALSNTDKRGLMLDLRDDADRAMLDRLLAQSDVLVENLRPGALARLGFGGTALADRHPHLVFCSINGFGNDSAYPGRPALDTVVQAMSGLMDLTRPDGEPTKAGISVSDFGGGAYGLLAILAALEGRDRHGMVPHFDLSMQDTSAWMTQMAWPGGAPAPAARVLQARDGWVVADGDAQAIARATRARSHDDRAALTERLQRVGVRAAPVLSVAEVAAHPHTQARGLIVERTSRDGMTWRVLGSPLRLLATPPDVRHPMRRLGSENTSLIDEFGLAPPSAPAAAPARPTATRTSA